MVKTSIWHQHSIRHYIINVLISFDQAMSSNPLRSDRVKDIKVFSTRQANKLECFLPGKSSAKSYICGKVTKRTTLEEWLKGAPLG